MSIALGRQNFVTSVVQNELEILLKTHIHKWDNTMNFIWKYLHTMISWDDVVKVALKDYALILKREPFSQ